MPARLIVAAVILLIALFEAGSAAEGFNEDELAHLHVSWMIGRGAIPYRDFFHQQPPLLHVLFSPIAAVLTNREAELFLAARIWAGLTAAAVIILALRLVPRCSGIGTLALSLGILALARPSGLLFQFRPDPLAIALVLAALKLLSHKQSPWHRTIASGLCVGLGIITTQKVMAIAAAILLWLMLRLLVTARENTGRDAIRLVLFALGSAVPLAALLLWAHGHHAAHILLHDVFGPPGYWVARRGWIEYTQEPILMEFPLAVVGFAAALQYVWRMMRRLPEANASDSLLGILTLCGVAAFLLTPVPSPQAYLVTVHLWLLLCAIRSVISRSQPDGQKIGSWPTNWRYLLAGAIIPIAFLKPVNLLSAISLGLVWVIIWRWGDRSIIRPEMKRAWLLTCLGFVSFAACVIASSRSLARPQCASQLVALHSIGQMAPPGSRALSAWPILTPTTSQACYHWFALWECYKSLPTAEFQREQLAALDDPHVRVVTCDPVLWEQMHPELLRRVRRKFQQIDIPPEHIFGNLVFKR